MITDYNTIQDYYQAANVQLPLKIPNLGCYRFDDLSCTTTPSINAYRNHFYEITFDIASGCNFQVDEFKFSQPKGHLSIISPRRLQSVAVTPEIMENAKGFSLFFDEDFLANANALQSDFPFLKSSRSPGIQLRPKTVKEIEKIFDLVLYEYKEYGKASSPVLKNMILIVLNKALNDSHLEKSENHKKSSEYLITERFESLVQKDFKKMTTVGEYAEALSTSAKHLSHCVKKTRGINALRLINTIRINYAKSLMLQTDMTSSQIAYSLNFDEPAYFFTLFKQIAGKTPKAYRKENLN